MSGWGLITLILMVAAGFVSFLPFIPGPALVWAIGIIYAIATDFREVGIGVSLAMTGLMIVGSTADWWTRFFGLKAEGSLSCGTLIVSMIGAIVGTIFIPVPVIGTLLGAAGGVMALVFYQEADWEKAFTAARGIFSAWVASFFVELIISVLIVILFTRALLNAWDGGMPF